MDVAMNPINKWIYGIVIAAGAAIAVTSFALLIPLDSTPAVSGATLIICISYALALIAWALVITFYSSSEKSLIWLNTHLLFLVVLPATIAATAMNVTTIQNTRNLLAGQSA